MGETGKKAKKLAQHKRVLTNPDLIEPNKMIDWTQIGFRRFEKC
jgi:hypothetical protein